MALQQDNPTMPSPKDHASADDNAAAMPDSGVAALVLLLRFLGVAMDAQQLRHQYGGVALGVEAMTRCARDMRLKARVVNSDWARLGKTPLPAIAEGRDGRFVILGKIVGDAALIQNPFAKGRRSCHGRNLKRGGAAGWC